MTASYVSNLSDFSASLECATVDGDLDWLELLETQGDEKADDTDLEDGSKDLESAAYRTGALSAMLARSAIRYRLNGQIEHAMNKEARSVVVEGEFRSLMLQCA